MKIIFLHGLAGVGKLTIGKHLSKLMDIPLFHNHLAVDLTNSLFEFGSPGFKDLRASIWKTAFSLAARDKVSFIFTFCPEVTVDDYLIPELVQAVETQGGEVVFIELTASMETLFDRCENEDRKKFDKLSSKDLYRKLIAAETFASPVMPHSFMTVDTEQHSPQESAQLIYKAVGE